MTKEVLIKLFMNGEFQPFKQMAHGSRWIPCDGWYKSKHGNLVITFEKNPSGSLIYTEEDRFELTETESKTLLKTFGI